MRLDTESISESKSSIAGVCIGRGGNTRGPKAQKDSSICIGPLCQREALASPLGVGGVRQYRERLGGEASAASMALFCFTD